MVRTLEAFAREGLRWDALLAAPLSCGYSGPARDRKPPLRPGIRPLSRKGGSGHGSGPGVVRSVVERVIERLLRYRRLDRRQDRSSTIVRSLLAAACIFILAEEACDF